MGIRILLGVACLALSVASLDRTVSAQTQEYVRGQNIQPAYEGWDKNPDGTINLYFGYLNRNWEETPHIPIGASNSFSPGAADRGQPTFFYPKRQMLLFKVVVPADFGKQELVWSVTHNGRTDKAVAWLAPFYELDNTVRRAQRGGSQRMSTPEELQAKPPSVETDGPQTFTVAVNEPLNLAVMVRDDGFPGPAKRRMNAEEGGGATEPAPEQLVRQIQARAPSAPAQDMVSAASASKTGLAVTWLHYRGPDRGPGTVTFEPMTATLEKTGGRAQTVARFSEPGTYVIRAVANDQIFTAPVNVTVNVTGAAQAR